ncbi:hypothetical protein DN539_32570, partial [Burkholderia multivorans]
VMSSRVLSKPFVAEVVVDSSGESLMGSVAATAPLCGDPSLVSTAVELMQAAPDRRRERQTTKMCDVGNRVSGAMPAIPLCLRARCISKA